MQLTIGQRRAIRHGVVYVMVGLLTALLYVVFKGELDQRYSVVNSLLIGFCLSLSLALGEFWLFRRQIRRVRFVVLFFARSVSYLFIVLLVTFNVFVVSRMRRFDLSYQEVLETAEFRDFMADEYYVVVFYCLLLMVIVNFTSQMNRKLGPGMLWSYITGKYTTPVRQQLVIMFIDLVGSKVIMKRLGATQYHNFLNDVIYDITESIVRHGGQVLHYVDDEIVVSWGMDTGVSNANCVRTYYRMKSQLHSLNEKYHDIYGFLPSVRTALHCGTVIRSEVGSVKTEVCAVGDVMNTTSRMLDHAIHNDIDIVVSRELGERIELPVLYEYEELGAQRLRGKHGEIQLFTLKSRLSALGE